MFQGIKSLLSEQLLKLLFSEWLSVINTLRAGVSISIVPTVNELERKSTVPQPLPQENSTHWIFMDAGTSLDFSVSRKVNPHITTQKKNLWWS